MADLIDRAALLAKIRPVEEDDYKCAVLMSNAKRILSEFIGAAPAVDAVEVVRCKDCVRRNDPGECPMCFLSEGDWDDYTNDDGYCERGERREENA